MKVFTKKLIKIIESNIHFCKFAPDEYRISQSKHIPNGNDALYSKYEEIEKFAKKIHGECHLTSNPYIHGDNRSITFYLVGDCVHMNKFDSLIKG